MASFPVLGWLECAFQIILALLLVFIFWIQCSTIMRHWRAISKSWAGALQDTTRHALVKNADASNDDHFFNEDRLWQIKGFILQKLLTIPLGVLLGTVSMRVFGSTHAAMVCLPLIAWYFKCAEAKLVKKSISEMCSMMPFVFLSTMPDCFSEYLHGVVVAEAVADDPDIHARFVCGWCMTGSFMCQLLTTIHLGGAYAITLLSMVIYLLGEVCVDNKEDVPSQCFRNSKLAGFGILKQLMFETEELDEFGLFMSQLENYAGVFFLGGLPFLFWQTSMAMAQAQHSAATTLAMLVSSLLGMKDFSSMVKASLAFDWTDVEMSGLLKLIVFAMLFVSAVFLILMMARVSASFLCPFGEWSIQSGCISSC